MGGKGRKRIEKNYVAAHGGRTRRPPPPDLSQVDALHSKLRQIMSFTSHLLDGFWKQRRKNAKSPEQENLDFPEREQIKFGYVVQAPPKLVAVPKVLKNVPDASRERIRLQIIEEYRKRKGRTSRPGLKLPTVTATHCM
ncbi:hypothetical protein P3X46_003780 [Hevea brasiliensis]|uniref:Uncharacterized protein n=1 Tax=Hevea brasiliensis TaxID=3981 RepID=A0ABQ9N9Y8_HEVBR|nr:hypothetical protein P3X46_003780 [Hevea brasiliensis]